MQILVDGHYMDLQEYLDGPYSLLRDSRCPYCDELKAQTVKNRVGQAVYILCSFCGYEMDKKPEKLPN